MNVRIASTAYAVPPDIETAEAVMARERERVETALRPLSARRREKVMGGLGLKRLHVCGEKQPYDLAREAAFACLAEAAVRASDVDLIIEFTTFPGYRDQYLSFAQKLSADLGAESSLNLSFKIGGCAGLHVALKNAAALMAADHTLRNALLITADSPPAGSRSLLPVTVQGDAGSAVLLRRDMGTGPVLLDTEVFTLSHLHDVIAVARCANGTDNLAIQVDSARIENELMPIYYLNFFRLVHKLLAKASVKLEDIDHFIYSNLSNTDQEGFARMLGLPPGAISTPQIAEYGHTFSSDLVINYTDLRRKGRIKPGQLLLFASAGIGFTWGVTLARA
jgi:3-oxoacyl-[acyl-carrier-protein] synthase-3